MSGSEKPGISSLLSNALLLGTSSWGLKECLEHPFLSAGFGLFAVRGLLGTVSYFDIDDENFKKIQEQVYKIADNFGFPLLAMDIMSCKCIRPEFNLLQLLGPAVDLVGFEMGQEIGEVLTVSHAATAGGAIVCAQQKREFLASAMFPVPFLADHLLEDHGERSDYHEILLAVGNLLALVVVTDYFPFS